MRRVFADALYWIAITNPRDPWRQTARTARRRLGRVQLITTDEVLVEVLAGLSKSGPDLRMTGVSLVRAVLVNRAVDVLPQSRDSFLAALDRYEARQDKG